MTRTIWLASYPKSGNTWFRLLLANLDSKDGDVDINAMESQGGIASARGPFDNLLLIESGLLTHDEVDALRPRVYEAQANGLWHEDEDGDAAEEVTGVRMIKVHDAYLDTPKGEPLMAGAKGAKGAIVIVRDPRDVALSLANHQNSSIDEAIGFMNNLDAGFCVRTNAQAQQFRQKLPTWSGHLASWLDQTDMPVHLVRYEDLQSDTALVFGKALAFAGRAAEPGRISRAVDAASFSKIKAQESKSGFREAPRAGRDRNFFRRGEAGAWRDELTPEQAARIEQAHAPMMARLGYKLSTAADWARSE